MYGDTGKGRTCIGTYVRKVNDEQISYSLSSYWDKSRGHCDRRGARQGCLLLYILSDEAMVKEATKNIEHDVQVGEWIYVVRFVDKYQTWWNGSK